MSDSTMAQAKRDFEIGYLTAARLKRWPLMGSGWFVWLGEGMGAGWLADARTKQPREFKSADAAISALEQIGFEVNELYR